MNIYSISLLFFSFGVILIAILVFVKRRDRVSETFGVFSISVAAWAFFASFWISQTLSAETALLFNRLSHMPAAFIPIVWTQFVFTFIKKKEPFKRFYLTNYLIAGFFCTISHAPSFLPPLATSIIVGFNYYTAPGPLYHLYVIFFFTLIPYAFYYLWGAYKISEGENRAQLQCLVIGTAIGFLAGGGTIPPVYRMPLPQYGVILMPLYPIFTGIALIRYGLFDVREIADAFQREKMAVLGTMAASLNHEIRNPLFVVRGKAECYIDSLERGKYSSYEELYEFGKTTVNPILSHVTRALDIVQKFTDFARPFNAKASKEAVVLREVFQDVQELVSSEFQRTEVNLVHNLNNGVSIMANRRHVEEILSNLVINACHAMGEKGGEVTVKAEIINKKTRIEVSDTGPGILKENLPRVFEPFFTTKGPKGTGLGLYITKQLVERNGGKISVKSRSNIGTTFLLEFKK